MAEAAVSNNPDVQYFQKLLKNRGIRLPRDVLIEEAVEPSRNPDVMEDAALIKRALMKGEISFRKFPSLACREVKNAWNKMVDGNAREVTEMIFFKIKRAVPAKNAEAEFRDYFEREILPELCEEEIQSDQVEYQKEKMVQFGFLKGRMDYLTTVTDPGSQKVIIERKSSKGDIVGNVFHEPIEGHRAESNRSHRYYYQTLSYKYILQNLPDPDPDPLQAVMVLRHQRGKREHEFHWGDVDGDCEQIHRLKVFCEEEALPRFLAVLKLLNQPKRPQRKRRSVRRRSRRS